MPNRVEREIEEILTKLESPGPGREPVRLRRSPWRTRARRFTARLPRLPALATVNAGNVMLWGIGLIFLAIVLGALGMTSPMITRWVVIVGLVLFFASFVLGFLYRDGGGGGGGVGRREAYWRGQRFDRRELRGPSSIDRLKAWWRGRNRGR